MDNQPAANPPRSSLIRLWPWLVVLLVLLFVGFIRFRLLDLPLERDEGEYAYAGQLILQGVPPYELAYNMKLPGTYYAYALGMAVFGQTIAGIHLTLIAANSLTIIFVFLLGRKLSGAAAGLVACASYGILSVSPAVMGLAAHANHFVVLFAVPATWLLWKAGGSNRPALWFFSGLLYGLAFVMKQQGICFCLFGWAFLLFQARDGKPLFPVQFVRQAFWFGLGMILPFAGVCLLMALAGVFSRFWFWTFTYAGAYVTGESLRGGWELFRAYFQKKLVIYAGFFMLAIAGLLAARRNKDVSRQTGFVLGFLFCSFLGTAAGLYFREHYFILSLPALAAIVGLAVCSLQRALSGMAMVKQFSAAVPLALFAVVLGWNVFYQRQLLLQLPANRVCQIIYRPDPFVEAPALAGYIHDHSAADARVAVIGSEPEIYFYSQRRSATGYIYTYALMEPQPYAQTMQREMMAEIEAGRPEYLVWVGYDNSWNVRPSSDRAVFD
jgi:4-amino-4-deoxy-L-arabinose transferase-like glycosyltransferase